MDKGIFNLFVLMVGRLDFLSWGMFFSWILI